MDDTRSNRSVQKNEITGTTELNFLNFLLAGVYEIEREDGRTCFRGNNCDFRHSAFEQNLALIDATNRSNG